MHPMKSLLSGRTRAWTLGTAACLSLAALGFWAFGPFAPGSKEASPQDLDLKPVQKDVVDGGLAKTVRFDASQAGAVDLKTVKVQLAKSSEIVTAPGRVAPNESRYAFITPRASGVIRSVSARIGQSVKAGDVLATIDSPEVAQARLDLYTEAHNLEVAQTKADWEKTIYQNTIDLLSRLKSESSPDEIQTLFENKPVGDNREKLMTAYAQYRLGKATIDRYNELIKQQLITVKQFQQVQAEYEVAAATYQSLMDQMDFSVKLSMTRAKQSLRQAETAVTACRERLRVLGVMPDGTLTQVRNGKVVGVLPDGTLPRPAESHSSAINPTAILPENLKARAVVEPIGAIPANEHSDEVSTLISTYPIWAPFDGVVLDRATVVPGIAVDKTHHVFTLADLSSVWIEANVQESDFDMLTRSQEAEIRFTSPAYPSRQFVGKVTYTGDLVDDKTRSVLLLAKAANPDRALKPGMFVEVEILCAAGKPSPRIPVSAVLTEGDESFVYVKTSENEYARREVTLGAQDGDWVAVKAGLEEGQEVVVENAFKLKAKGLRLVRGVD